MDRSVATKAVGATWMKRIDLAVIGAIHHAVTAAGGHRDGARGLRVVGDTELVHPIETETVLDVGPAPALFDKVPKSWFSWVRGDHSTDPDVRPSRVLNDHDGVGQAINDLRELDTQARRAGEQRARPISLGKRGARFTVDDPSGPADVIDGRIVTRPETGVP